MTIDDIIKKATEALINETDEATQLEYKQAGFETYGICMGVKGEVPEHNYEDNKFHYQASHGICKPCYAKARKQ